MDKLNTPTQAQPELTSELESIKEQIKRTSVLSSDIAHKLISLKKFSPFEPSDEKKSEDDFIGALRNERLALRDTNDLLQRCLNHLNELY